MSAMENVVDAVEARELLRSGRGRKLRQRYGLSMRDVADAVGVDVVTVARWEGGRFTPRRDLAVRYGELFRRLEQLPASTP